MIGLGYDKKHVSYIDPQFELLTWQHALRSANVEVLAVKTGTDLRYLSFTFRSFLRKVIDK